MGLLEEVRRKVDRRCFSRVLRKEKCALSLDGAPSSRLILDLDKPGSPLHAHQTRCDYLFVGEEDGGWMAAIEIKGGRLDAATALRQLRAGTEAAQRLLPPNVPVNFRPVVVCGKCPAPEERRLRKAGRLIFHGQAQPVRLLTCGQPLMQALARAA